MIESQIFTPKFRTFVKNISTDSKIKVSLANRHVTLTSDFTKQIWLDPTSVEINLNPKGEIMLKQVILTWI